MTCKDAIALMSDYLEMLCGQELLRDLEQHLQDCPPCRAYLFGQLRGGDLVGRDAGRDEGTPPPVPPRPAVLRRELTRRGAESFAVGECPTGQEANGDDARRDEAPGEP